MKTKVTEMLGIRYPIIQAGMIWVSGWKLAAAASRAGCLGVIGAGSMRPDLLVEHIDKMKAAVGTLPWAVNIPLFYKYTPEMIDICIHKEVPHMITSGGSPKKYTAALQEHGMKVIHVTASPALAVKCEQAGVDAVVVEGFEAGGHNGRDELTTMCLVPQTVDAVSCPVIAAGGIYDGRTMAAALALGAQAVQIGTRFVLAEESSAHQAFKQAVIEAQATDTELILRKIGPVRTIMNTWAKGVKQAETDGAQPEELQNLLGEGRSRRGMFEGDREAGELEIGQIAGALDTVEPIDIIVSRIINDCATNIQRLSGLMP